MLALTCVHDAIFVRKNVKMVFHARRYRFVNRWRVLLGSIHNKPINAKVAEVKTIVYHSSYLPFVDANIDDNSRDIAVLALAQPLTFNGRTRIHQRRNTLIHTHLSI